MSVLSQASHPVLRCAETVSDAVKSVAQVEPTFMSVEEKADALRALVRAEAQVAGLRLKVQAAAGDLAQVDAARDAGAWLAHQARLDPETTSADHRLATALERRWQQLGAAVLEGRVNLPQARVIADALDALPRHVGQETLTAAETRLVTDAAQFRPRQLRRLGRRILEVVAPEIAEAEEARRLAAEEETARERARLTFRPLGDGTTRITGLLPDPIAARLRTYLEAFTSPRHQHQHQRRATHHPSPADAAPDASADPTSDTADNTTSTADGYGGGEADRIPYAQHLAHAFGALLEHLDPDRLPDHGGDATTVIVTITLEQLQRELGAAGLLDADLSQGLNLTAAQARRLACTAQILPAVLGSDSEILDLGRSRRLFTPAQRRALRLRDQRCRADGCTIPATWCEAHHLTPWSHGGNTDLADGILLCSFHHQRAHDRHYTNERLPNGDLRYHRRN